MEDERFSWFAKNVYLRKRPRFSPTLALVDEQMPSTSTAMPSMSSSSCTSKRRTQQRVLIEPSSEELLKWQEKQISKCIVQNTINGMVESYLALMEGEDANNAEARTADDREAQRETQRETYQAHRAQEFFEDSAIQWVVDHHGLYNHTRPLFNNIEIDIISSSSSSISLSSPVLQEDDGQFEGTSSINAIDNPTISTEAKVPEAKALAEKTLQQTDPVNVEEILASAAGAAASTSYVYNADDLGQDDHYDFINAAVTAAIQEKGLSKMTNSPRR